MFDYGMSETDYDIIIKQAKSILPQKNRLKENFYVAKFMMKPFGLGYQKVNICLNLCMFYYNEEVNLTECKKCEHAHYKPTTNKMKDNCRMQKN